MNNGNNYKSFNNDNKSVFDYNYKNNINDYNKDSNKNYMNNRIKKISCRFADNLNNRTDKDKRNN